MAPLLDDNKTVFRLFCSVVAGNPDNINLMQAGTFEYSAYYLPALGNG